MKRTYYPNYFSIEDIFVTQEKIPCQAEQQLCKLGFLDPSGESPDLTAGQQVELPLWYILQVQKERSRNQFYKWVPQAPQTQLVSKHFYRPSRVNIPDIYKSNYGEICRADATAVDLGKLNKHFYELGRYVAAFDRNGFVGKMIYEVIWDSPTRLSIIKWFISLDNPDLPLANEISEGPVQQYQQRVAQRSQTRLHWELALWRRLQNQPQPHRVVAEKHR